MTDLEPGTAGPGRVRGFVANRSRTQRLGLLSGVLVLALLPFGGLRSASESSIEPLALDQRIDIGPFEVTIENVEQLTDLAPAVSPEPGNRLLIIRVTATNHTDRAESARLVAEALSGSGTGALPWPGDDEPRLRIFDVDDAVELPPSEQVNPDQSYDWAMILQQEADWDPERLVLRVTGYTFLAEDPQTLDPNRWELDDTPLAEGPLTVEVEE